jgi:glycosyltransferase involved in cell wall biosynthesis
MTDKPRLACVIPSLNPGGTERQLLLLAEGLAPEWEIVIYCTREPGAWAERVAPHARVEPLGLRSGWDPRMYARLRRRFADFRPHVVHTFLFGFDYWSNRAARAIPGVRVVNSRRQLPHWKRARHVWWQRRANPLADAIVANADAVARYCAEQEGEPLDRYTVIRNGLDIEAWNAPLDRTAARAQLGLPDASPVVGLVGNFAPEKDHALFLEAARLLLAERNDVRFVIAARGEMPSEL